MSTKAQIASGDGFNRNKNDFYPTPKYALDSLFSIINDIHQDGIILEPCCGIGNISKYLEDKLYRNVMSFELNKYSELTNDYGKTYFKVENYGNTGINFLEESIFDYINLYGNIMFDTGKIDYIITNPPFSEDINFILRSFAIARRKVIMLLKLNHLSSKIRKELIWNNKETNILELSSKEPKKYNKHIDYFIKNNHLLFRVKNIIVLTKRLKFEGFKHSTPLEFMWVEWEKYYNGKINMHWI